MSRGQQQGQPDIVRNPLKEAQDNAIKSSISLTDLASALQQLDLSTVPPHKTADAIRDHLSRIIGDTAIDPAARQAIQVGRAIHARQAADKAIQNALTISRAANKVILPKG
jgi:hypothetical protein